MSFDAGVFVMSSRGDKSSAQALDIACEEPIDRDRSRKLAMVDASTALDRCRSMVKAARGDAARSDGTSDGKTSEVRDAVQANQRLTEAVDD